MLAEFRSGRARTDLGLTELDRAAHEAAVGNLRIRDGGSRRRPRANVRVEPSRGEEDAKGLPVQLCHASYEIAKAPVIAGAPLPQVDGFVFLVLAMIKVQSVRRKPRCNSELA